MDRFGLGPLMHAPLAELSKGSAQKVGLAQALLVPPGLLVLDEPWSGLDADARAAVPEVVQQVVRSGGTVVVADHQQQVAALSPDLRWHVEGGAGRGGPGPGRRVSAATAGGRGRADRARRHPRCSRNCDGAAWPRGVR